MPLDINKQKMKYSLSLGLQPQYRRDDDGNIIYTGYTDDDGTFIPYLDEDGNKIPEVTGEEVFVDLGGYIGDTVKDFVNTYSAKYKRIYIGILSGDNLKRKSVYFLYIRRKKHL